MKIKHKLYLNPKAIWALACCCLFFFVQDIQAQDCRNFVEDEVINVEINTCEEDAMVCVSIFLEDILEYEVLDNGLMYNGSYEGCNFDTVLAYSYYFVHGQGEDGPYRLESWEVDGEIYSGEFDDIYDLVANMNTWDPNGNWAINSAAKLIIGGVNTSEYSVMQILQYNLNNTTTTVGFSRAPTALGTYLNLGVGQHEIIFFEMGSNCSDTLQVNVVCMQTEEVSVNIFKGLASVACLDKDDLLGTIRTVENICPENSGESVFFTVDPASKCVVYSALAMGSESACYVACDEFGFCDTTYITVNVVDPPENTIVAQVPIGGEGKKCLDTSVLGDDINIFENACEESSGSNVEFEFDQSNQCVEFLGLSPGIDTACVRICNGSSLCDTIYVIVTTTDALIEAPIAVNDTINNPANSTEVINVLANDGNTAISNMEITSAPTNGEATLNFDFTISYRPNEDFCGVDYFEYEICNPGGCSKATVEIYVSCGELRIYNAFSPNGDGKNDTFLIEGIQSYPDNRVYIYNLWGNLVFTNSDGMYQNSWDGTWKSKDLPDGTYYYLIELNDGSSRQYTGWVQIYR